MGILLCEQNFREVWIRNKSVRAEIGHILRTHTHTHAAKLVVEIIIAVIIVMIFLRSWFSVVYSPSSPFSGANMGGYWLRVHALGAGRDIKLEVKHSNNTFK